MSVIRWFSDVPSGRHDHNLNKTAREISKFDTLVR